MKIFISWSGELSRDVAEILRKYLPCMIQGLGVFMSGHDLESGGRWNLQLAKELDQSEFGLMCLTPDNVDSPWIIFEAGALTKHFEGRACGLLLNGLTAADVGGPLSQFQNRPFEAQEVRALLGDVNKRMADPLEAEQLSMVFQKWWPDLEEEYQRVLTMTQTTRPQAPRRDEREILEEILLRVRSVERTLNISPMSTEEKGIRDLLQIMNESQRELLLELCARRALHQITTMESIRETYSSDDIRQLVQWGFITDTKDDIVIVNEGIANMIAQSVFASFSYARFQSMGL